MSGMPKLKLVPEIYVEDIDATKRFYVDVFGFEIKYERPKEQFVYWSHPLVKTMHFSARL